MFITLEGIEGAGKTTQLARMIEYLERNGLPVVSTREPGGTPLGEDVRTLLLEQRSLPISVAAETLLMYAARAEHLEKVIGPALAQGYWVLCDRFNDASYAYQGNGRGVALEKIALLDAWVLDGLQPDATLLLDLPVKVGLARAKRRGAGDRFEQENMAFFERVRQGYLQQAEHYPERYKVINANQPIAAVGAEIESWLALEMKRWLLDRLERR